MLAKEIKKKLGIQTLIKLLTLYFQTEKYMLKIKNINYPKEQCIFSMWHCHQMMTYGIEDKNKFYTLISASNDGEIIAQAALTVNIKSIRGSKDRRGTAASLEILDKLKEGNNIAIMVDGPKGPVFKVKEGIVNIAKLSGIPIVPCYWHSKQKNFFKFNTWDCFRAPLGFCKTIALYGEPIHIPKQTPKEEYKKWCLKIEEEMQNLKKDIEENYKKYQKSK